jgi:hypothetical protein
VYVWVDRKRGSAICPRWWIQETRIKTTRKAQPFGLQSVKYTLQTKTKAGVVGVKTVRLADINLGKICDKFPFPPRPSPH